MRLLFHIGILNNIMIIGLICLFLCGCGSPQGYQVVSGPAAEPLPSPTPMPVSTQPATLLECPTGGQEVTIGSTVAVICNGLGGNTGGTGQPGASGPTGPAGQNGSNGQDSTPITFTQVCKANAAVYPGTFPEVLMCINNQFYGVYSSNGGFLALMPPGAYSSNGINSSCTFTIKPNCVAQ